MQLAFSQVCRAWLSSKPHVLYLKMLQGHLAEGKRLTSRRPCWVISGMALAQ